MEDSTPSSSVFYESSGCTHYHTVKIIIDDICDDDSDEPWYYVLEWEVPFDRILRKNDVFIFLDRIFPTVYIEKNLIRTRQAGKRLVWKCSKNSENENEQYYSLFSIGQELPKNCEQWEHFEITYSSTFVHD